MPSRWPPDDFRVEVVTVDQTSDGLVPRQAFYVFADGVTVYAESTRLLASTRTNIPLPVFDRVAAYQMQRPSLRALCRDFERAGLFESQPENEPTPAGSARRIRIQWQADGLSYGISGTVGGSGIMDRAVRILDAFLPPGKSLSGSSTSSRTKRNLDEVPSPVQSPLDALAILQRVAVRESSSWRQCFHLFCLALAVDRPDSAQTAFELLRRRVDGNATLEGFGSDADAVEQLGKLLAER